VLAYFGFFVKTSGDPAALASALRAAVLSIDPQQPFYQLTTLEQQAAESIAQERFDA
jgi:hypothetical protein